ncbi:very short patch repair endonuclease [Puia sp. P3]|uniref:very short patch repair endonuclease n=1 Tax=Puia sp. P3 TaxID=3423952 RepID=UPI003D6716D8
MSDVHSAEVRSYNMSRIRSKDTKPELIIRKILFANGFRFRLHRADLPGKPDIVLAKYKTVIFVHGCFWHGHDGCKYFVVPKSRTEWWLNKINRNKELDQINTAKLKSMGWRVIEIFECHLKKSELEKTADWLVGELRRVQKISTITQEI